MEIKILLSQHSCQKIRDILGTHAKSKSQQKYSFSLDRSLCQPVIHKRGQLRRSWIHWFRRAGFMKGFNHNIPIYLLRYFIIRFFQSWTFVNITFQMIPKRYQFHFFIKIMENNICILILKAIQTDHLSESLCSFSCKFKVFDRIKSNCLLKIQILHTIFHSLSPS